MTSRSRPTGARRAFAALMGVSLALAGLGPACVGEDPTVGPAPDASASGGAGSERQPCYPNGTCDVPLRCISQICVLPSEGSDASTVDGSNGSSSGSVLSDSGGVLSDSGGDSSLPDAGLPTIHELVAANANLAQFAELLDENVLNATLSGPGPLTLFAPMNAAFSASPIPNANEVRNHIVAEVISEAAFDDRTVVALSGKTLVLETGPRVYVMGGPTCGVEVADIQASNGVIHIIAGVLLD